MVIDRRDRDEKMHYFMISHKKIAKIKNRRSSVHKETDSLCTDDR
jgi:hypothetical protein